MLEHIDVKCLNTGDYICCSKFIRFSLSAPLNRCLAKVIVSKF